ncbi:MAG TPA: hypothetical protein VIJ39_11955 [Solirubrobacteraceae bacterium]
MGSIRKVVLDAVMFSALLVSLTCASNASAATVRWQVNSSVSPTNLALGDEGQIVVIATNLGDAEVDGASNPVTVTDKLPSGLTATAISGRAGPVGFRDTLTGVNVECSPMPLSCTYSGALPPYEYVEVTITVRDEAGASSGVVNEASVVGGGAPRVSARQPIGVSDEPNAFGVENYEFALTNEDGSPDTQAGSHPFQLTTTLALNKQLRAGVSVPTALTKDLRFDLPPGLIGNPTVVSQCTSREFSEVADGANGCPAKTAIGVASTTMIVPGRFGSVPFTFPVPLFNLEPNVGEPARFGFTVFGVPVVLDTSVRTGGDYGVTVSINDISETAGFMGGQVTFWGVPDDPSHDQERGWECVDDGLFALLLGMPACTTVEQQHPAPFLTLPTSCTGSLKAPMIGDSWAAPGSFTAPVEPLFESALDGCNRLPFEPSISVAPDGQAGSTPTGLTVGVHVPQDSALNPNGLSEANVKNTTVALPSGVALNPAGADGLEACSEAQVALSSDSASSCPEASKVGTVEITSPLLPEPVVGAAYLAAQDANPFGSLVALYIVAEDVKAGFLVKVAGEVKPDPVTGQLVATFENTPQLPFEDFNLHFFGGSRAPLSTPAVCGGYTTTASIAPWSGNEPATPSSMFDITSGPNGSACASPLPFSPSLTAGTTNIQAGGFSPFTMTVSREDGQQNISAIQLHMPPGLSGLLTGVELCPEAQANAGSCGANSLIGETTVSVGLGGDPFSVTGGKVYITGPYEGAPFGISVVVPAKAGPYNLGTVVVRGRIEVNPITSALTITTDSTGPYAIPHILDGIPLEIKHVNFVTTRPGFTFNPTNCDPMGVTGSISSVEGSSSPVSVPFQVTNCAILGFKPGFTVSTSGKTSRADGASLHVRLSYPKAAFGSQANIKSVKVDLPKRLPSRLETLQKACPAATFEANPAACSSQSRIGTAKATTPLVPVPLEGPVFFVSHAGEKFPELIVVLSGYGVTVDLHSETFISKAGITSSTFRTIPDVPVGTFELTLPEGPYSALAAPGGLCNGALKMPTAFTAQNGTVIHQNTPIGVTGCPKHKTTKKTKKKDKKASHKGNTHGKKK